MSSIAKIVYKPHPVQRKFHNSKARFRLFLAGRRSGKTFAAAFEAIKMVIKNPNGRGWIVAPNYPVATVAWEEFLKVIEPLRKQDPKFVTEINKANRSITFRNGHKVECKSAHNPDGLVGAKLHWLWVDEAALVSEATWDIIRPCLMDYQAPAIFTTTPRGKNWIWKLYGLCLEKDKKQYEVFHCSTYNNPYIAREEIEDLAKDYSQLMFKQEIMAEFLDENSQVFKGVEAQAIGDFEPPIAGEKYFMGVDLARHNDFTVLTIIRKSTGNVVAFKRFTDTAWSLQKKQIKVLASAYNAEVFIDSTGIGDPVAEDLKKDGLRIHGIKFTNSSKQNMIENLVIKIEQGQITYPKIQELIFELNSYEMEITNAGNIRYNAPDREGFHDDCVISLALAALALQKPTNKMMVFKGGEIR